MNFGEAIEALKDGKSVARAGWNGKGMFVYLVKGSFDSTDAPRPLHVDNISTELFSLGDHGTTTRLPHIAMATATGATLNGWLASQSDMLADDWEVVGGAVG